MKWMRTDPIAGVLSGFQGEVDDERLLVHGIGDEDAACQRLEIFDGSRHHVLARCQQSPVISTTSCNVIDVR